MDARKRILLVDDEPEFRFSASIALRKAGYDIVEAGDGREALWKIRESRESGEPISFLVTDIRMPVLSGLELVDEMRRRDIDIPVFAITGFSDKEVLAELSSRGCIEHIEKPFAPQELLERLEAFINKSECKARSNGKRGPGAP